MRHARARATRVVVTAARAFFGIGARVLLSHVVGFSSWTARVMMAVLLVAGFGLRLSCRREHDHGGDRCDDEQSAGIHVNVSFLNRKASNKRFDLGPIRSEPLVGKLMEIKEYRREVDCDCTKYRQAANEDMLWDKGIPACQSGGRAQFGRNLQVSLFGKMVSFSPVRSVLQAFPCCAR